VRGRMNIKAVVFDIDGTLYPNYQMILQSIPFSITHIGLIINFSKVRKEIRTLRPINNFHKKQQELLAKYMNISSEKAGEIIKREIYGKWETTFKGIKPFPGVEDLLYYLKERGIKLGVLSDFPINKKLDYLKLPDVWDVKDTSENTGYLKPNPEPFYRVSKDLNILPEEILYVGNNYEYDVVGARNCNMYTAYLGREREKGKGADIFFRSYNELQEKIIPFLPNTN